MKVTFTHVGETINKQRFQEVDADGDPVLEGGQVGAFYLSKSAVEAVFGGKTPETITLTVEAAR